MSLTISSNSDWTSAKDTYTSGNRFSGTLKIGANFTLSGDSGTITKIFLAAGVVVDGQYNTIILDRGGDESINGMFDFLGGTFKNLTIDANQHDADIATDSYDHNSPPTLQGRRNDGHIVFKNATNALAITNIHLQNAYCDKISTSAMAPSSQYCTFTQCSVTNTHHVNNSAIAYAGCFFANNSYDVTFTDCLCQYWTYSDDYQGASGFCSRVSGGTTTIDNCVVQARVYARYIGGFTGMVDGGTVNLTQCIFDGTVYKGSAFVGTCTNSSTVTLDDCYAIADLDTGDASCFVCYRMQNGTANVTCTNCYFKNENESWSQTGSAYLGCSESTGTGTRNFTCTDCYFEPSVTSTDIAPAGITQSLTDCDTYSNMSKASLPTNWASATWRVGPVV